MCDSRKIFFVFCCIAAFECCGCVYRATGTDDSAKNYFTRAETALKDHKFNEALFVYTEYYNKYPAGKLADEALYKKGFLECYLDKLDDAQQSFETLIEKYPKSKWHFDASVWSGVIGDALSANKNDSSLKKTVKQPQPQTQDTKELASKIQKLESENTELRRQLQKLRELVD
jgi:hypothetical protein